MSINTIDIAIIPHPFSTARLHHTMPAGGNIADIIEHLQPDPVLRRHAHVYVGDVYVEQENWFETVPQPGASLSIRMIPTGGGGSGNKNTLRGVMSLAVMAAAASFAGPLAATLGTWGMSGLTGAAMVGLDIVSKLALSAIAPPARPRFGSEKESQTLFIQGARNNLRPFSRVPRVLGKHRMFPPLGAPAYTETVGNDQYVRMLFIWGYGPLDISDLKIGETPLSEFAGVQVEMRQGRSTDTPVTLYTSTVLQNDMQVELTSAGGYVVRTSEEDVDEISVDITLPRGLMTIAANGERQSATVKLEVQYSPTGLNQWSPGALSFKSVAAQSLSDITCPAAYVYGGSSYTVRRIDRIVLDPSSGAAQVITGTPFRTGIDSGSPQPPLVPFGSVALAQVERRSGDADIISGSRITDERSAADIEKYFQSGSDFLCAAGTVNTMNIAAGSLRSGAMEMTGKQSTALRRSFSFKVTRGQYDVRVRRLTADSVDDSVFDQTAWTALRSLRAAEPVAMEGLAMTALRIKATDQLSGVIDRFNGVVHSILPDWNGSGWVEQVTSNPASLFRHVLQGNANARPLADSRLNIDVIEDWHDRCAEAGREYNGVIDYDVSVRGVLDDIAAAGRAAPALIDGKWAVVEDRPQTVPVQHFTPRNTFGFRGGKTFDDVPHALRVNFINRDQGWMRDEILVYDDGQTAETATIYETLELQGITQKDQAWVDGRYHIATARLRPETYSFNADIEHIVCTRGDLIRFTHDVPLFGLMSGRVKSVLTSGSNATGVVLDAAVGMEDGVDYAIRFRLADGASLSLAVTTVVGADQTTLTFTTPVPIANGPEAGDLFLFGEAERESVELIVRSIEPQGDLSARLTCVDAAPAVHTAGEGEIPLYNSNITVPADMRRPPTPVLATVQTGDEVLVRNPDGSVGARIVVTLNPPSSSVPLRTRVMIRAYGETDFGPAQQTEAGDNQISIVGVQAGEYYDVQIRYVTASGVMSEALLVANHLVTGGAASPSNVNGFTCNVQGQQAHLSWDASRDLSLSHYRVRHAPQCDTATWESAIDLVLKVSQPATSITVPAMTGSYLIKAVNFLGVESDAESIVNSPVDWIEGLNVVETVTENPGFTGTKENVTVDTGILRLSAQDLVDAWNAIDDIDDMDVGGDNIAEIGTYYFADTLDLTETYTSKVSAEIEVTGIDLSQNIDSVANVDQMANFDQPVASSKFSVQLQLRTTNDDPGASPTWSDWKNFVVGDYTARAYQFRIILGRTEYGITPEITVLKVRVDMPDRVESESAIASLAAGSSVVFGSAFRAVPAVSVMPHNLATGDYYVVSAVDKAGFSIRFYNSSNVGVVRTFDYIAKGYGRI